MTDPRADLLADPLTVRPGERGLIRLFALDMPAEQALFLREPGAAAQMLGVDDLDPSQIDIFATADIEELGLAGYLIDGYAIPSDQIDRPALAALTGYVLVIRSRAFRGGVVTLTPAPQLTLTGTYREPATNWSGDQIETASAKPRIPPRAGRSAARRIGAMLFGVVMLLIGIVLIAIVS